MDNNEFINELGALKLKLYRFFDLIRVQNYLYINFIEEENYPDDNKYIALNMMAAVFQIVEEDIKKCSDELKLFYLKYADNIRLDD